MKINEIISENFEQDCNETCPNFESCSTDQELDERGPASRKLCLSRIPDSELGASNLASCKSQGLRARDGRKSHLVHGKRVTVGSKKIKGKQHGGPLPDWS